MIRAERERVSRELSAHRSVVRVWPSAANFILAEFKDVPKTIAKIRSARLLVRDARAYPELPGTLRITIGACTQNTRLLQALA
jgi:histidinol-phosphate aminotransferase